jgi:hypothetical protein
MAVLHMLRGDQIRAEENFEIAHNGSLHYGAFRLANRSLLGLDGKPALDSLRELFFRTWVGARPPEDDDLIEAIFDYIPLQRAEHRQLVTNGLVLSGLSPKRFRASFPKTLCGAP